MLDALQNGLGGSFDLLQSIVDLRPLLVELLLALGVLGLLSHARHARKKAWALDVKKTGGLPEVGATLAAPPSARGGSVAKSPTASQQLQQLQLQQSQQEQEQEQVQSPR